MESFKIKLFDIIKSSNSNYEIFEKIKDLHEKYNYKSLSEENEKFYNSLTPLLTSVNNAGWEERHSQQIDMLWKIRNDISIKYEDDWNS